MSQAKVDRYKEEKKNRKKIQKKKKAKQVVEILVCAAILGALVGFPLGRHMYQKTYEKEKNIYYCYKSLNIEIKNGNNKKIITVYEKFINDDDYSNFMIKLKKHNEQANLGILQVIR